MLSNFEICFSCFPNEYDNPVGSYFLGSADILVYACPSVALKTINSTMFSWNRNFDCWAT